MFTSVIRGIKKIEKNRETPCAGDSSVWVLLSSQFVNTDAVSRPTSAYNLSKYWLGLSLPRRRITEAKLQSMWENRSAKLFMRKELRKWSLSKLAAMIYRRCFYLTRESCEARLSLVKVSVTLAETFWCSSVVSFQWLERQQNVSTPISLFSFSSLSWTDSKRSAQTRHNPLGERWSKHLSVKFNLQ